MKFLYLILNIGSISIPLLYSFHRRMNFIQYWKKMLLSTSLVAFIFLVWDGIFTKNYIWGFNSDYYLGIKLWGMPLEEWLFFFCIPYASIFIHYFLAYTKPQWQLTFFTTKIITIVLVLLCVFLVINNLDKYYTFINFLILLLILMLGWVWGLQYLSRFYLSFLFILIPFFIVNGILTGSFIAEPVVWYKQSENLGIRIFTIPIEDIGYAFSMLFLNLLILENLKKQNDD